MATLRQLWLPRVSRVVKKKKLRASPQPHVDEFRQIKQYELFHRPFDLRFRGEINEWLKRVKEGKIVEFKKILEPIQNKLIRLYFYPQKDSGKWLNQDDVLGQVNLKNKKILRQTLISTLIRIWKKVR